MPFNFDCQNLEIKGDNILQERFLELKDVSQPDAMNDREYTDDNASMRSTSILEEIDIVDIYKNKMKTHKKLKKKNLQLIFAFVLFSFLGLLFFACILMQFLKSPSHYLFDIKLGTGIKQVQLTISDILSISFFSQSQFLGNLIIGSSSFEQPTLGIMSDTDYQANLLIYFTNTKNEIGNFIKSNSNNYSLVENTLDDFINKTPTNWQMNTTFTIKGTLLNFLKEAYISMNLEDFSCVSKCGNDFLSKNCLNLAMSIPDFEIKLEEEMSASLNDTLGFLNIILICRYIKQCSIIRNIKYTYRFVCGKGSFGGKLDFRFIDKNKTRKYCHV